MHRQTTLEYRNIDYYRKLSTYFITHFLCNNVRKGNQELNVKSRVLIYYFFNRIRKQRYRTVPWGQSYLLPPSPRTKTAAKTTTTKRSFLFISALVRPQSQRNGSFGPCQFFFSTHDIKCESLSRRHTRDENGIPMTVGF